MTTEPPVQPAAGRTRAGNALDIVTVFLLSITAVLTAWCGFEASKWSGEMSIAFSQASSYRIQASTAEGQARDARQYDLSIYTEWVLAEADNDSKLIQFIQQRFTSEFRDAFQIWEAGGRKELGPLSMDEYIPPGAMEAERFSRMADAKFGEALANNQRGDNYSLLTVLFALVLFLTAMSQRVLVVWGQRALLGLAVVVGIGCIFVMMTFPIKI